jgi:hypothetical protein
MNEDEAILYLLDLGTGASHRSQEVLDKVTEIQEACGVTEGDERELKERLDESDSVSVKLGRYGLRV